MRTLVLGSLLLTVGASSLHAQSAPCSGTSQPGAVPPEVVLSPLDRPCGTEDGAILSPAASGDAQSAFWVSADYLLWWIKKAPLGGPLVTTDRTNGATPTAGGLADPTTQTVIGGNRIGDNPFSGARFQAGMCLGDDVAVEVGGFFLANQLKNQAVNSDSSGNPFLFRPYLNVDTGNPNAGTFVSSGAAAPGALAGGVLVASKSSLWGANANLAGVLCRTEGVRLDALAGFRYLNLHERLDIRQATTDLTGGNGNFGGATNFTSAGDTFYIQDNFHTINQFYGGQLGLRAQTQFGRLGLAGTARVSLGDTQEIVRVDGATTLVRAAGGSATLPGGILALPSNSGSALSNRFAVVPEVGVLVGLQLTSWMRLSAGYDFLSWSSVVRPGNQIPLVVSAGQIPSSSTFGVNPQAVPGPVSHSTDFWSQGLTFGLGLSF